MTEEQAENIATVVIGLAVVGGAYVIFRDPMLRRAAWRLARTGLAATASWLVAEGRRTWAETGGAGGLHHGAREHGS
ncbi:MAG TPA: hypothetical protein VK928_06630 [Longimicrobiales bacterium]|nr:hypothetical protein [Longimicrobiales bacterium]